MKSQSQEFTSSGTFTVPSGVSCVFITMIGGGSGGKGGTGGGGGGSGEYTIRLPKVVTPGGTLSITVGTGGAGGVDNGGGSTGNDSSVGSYNAKGGRVSSTPLGHDPNPGGGVSGLLVNSNHYEPAVFTAGHAGGPTPGSTGVDASPGDPAPGHAGGLGGTGSLIHGPGGGGGASLWGTGGNGGNGGNPAVSGSSASPISYGAGGGGSGAVTPSGGAGGNGADGYVLVEWLS